MKCEKIVQVTEDGSLMTICNGLLRVFAMDGGAGMGFAAETSTPSARRSSRSTARSRSTSAPTPTAARST